MYTKINENINMERFIVLYAASIMDETNAIQLGPSLYFNGNARNVNWLKPIGFNIYLLIIQKNNKTMIFIWLSIFSIFCQPKELIESIAIGQSFETRRKTCLYLF